MKALSEKGVYEITEEMREALKDFVGGYASEEECFAMINKLYDVPQNIPFKTGFYI